MYVFLSRDLNTIIKNATPLDLFRETHCSKVKGLSPAIEDALVSSMESMFAYFLLLLIAMHIHCKSRR
jgi:hypothetical protein